MFTIYTDGATSRNGMKNAVGGYGYVILRDGEEIGRISGHVSGEKVTNNVCELSAVMMGLRSVMGSFPDAMRAGEEITVISDSAYFVNCIKDQWYVKWRMNGWKNSKRQPVENRELWEEILNLIEHSNTTVQKVKGHAQDPYNEIADELAREGAKNVSGS